MPVQRVPIVCAWCEAERKAQGLLPKVLGYSEIDVPPGQPATSHGICTDCEAEFFPNLWRRDGEHREGLVEDYFTGVLQGADREAYERHLASCPACQKDLEELKALDARLRKELGG